MNSSRTSKRRVGPQLAIGLVTASVLSVGIAVPAYAAGTNTVTNPGFINIANANSYVISGTAESAITAVMVEVADVAGIASVQATATVTADSADGRTWSATVNTTGLAEGDVEIFATFGAACGQLDCSADATVVKDTEAPQEPAVFPADGEIFASPTEIFIESTSDQDRTHFTFGTAPANPTQILASLVPAPPLASHTVSSNQQVKATAWDLAGNPSTVMVANYTVDAPAPTATPTTTTLAVSPTSPQVVGTSVVLTATVSPAATPGTIEYFDGTTSLGATGTVTPTVGTHSYTAVFTPTNTAAFSSSTSTPTSFTVTAVVVTPPTGGGGGGTPPAGGGGGTPPAVVTPPAVAVVTAPKVMSRTPALNANGVSRLTNLLAKFDKNVTGVNARSYTLRTKSGSAVAAVVTYNPTTRMAMLNPTRTLAADTTYVATLSSAIKAGKSLAVTRWSFTTGARPTIAARTPGVNARNVARAANVTVKFSEKVTGISRYSATLWTPSGVRLAAVVSYNPTTRVATLNPSSKLAAGTKYTVRLSSAIKDTAGNRFAATRWSYTTGRA